MSNTFDSIRSKVDLLDFAFGHTTLKKVGNEFHGPCPICGGNDRFAVIPRENRWLCRQGVSHPGGIQSGDVTDLASLIWGCSLAEAAKKLVGGDIPLPARKREAEKARAKMQSPTWNTPEWQEECARLVRMYYIALANSPGEEFLTARGITAASAKAWRLGYTRNMTNAKGEVMVAHGIAIPWIGQTMSGAPVYTALKWRRFGAVAGGDRFYQRYGGQQLVFGGHLRKGTESCIVIEGEFNAISCWQALAGQTDVLSGGGEMVIVNAIQPILHEYDRIVVWVDSPVRAEKIAQELGRPAHVQMFCSPGGSDANDILVRYGDAVLADMLVKLLNA